MLFIMGLDTYLFSLDLQMLIDHGSFQSVQMLRSLNWNKHTILIIMQTSFICSLQILITSLALFQGMYIKSTYDGLHVITGTTENVSFFILKDFYHAYKYVLYVLSAVHFVI